MKLIGLSGSLRAGSLNTKLLQEAGRSVGDLHHHFRFGHAACAGPRLIGTGVAGIEGYPHFSAG